LGGRVKIDRMMKLTNKDWNYLAGLFDGEGCVTVSIVKRKSDSRGGKAGSKIMNLSLRIANNDPRVLLWLEKNFGGKVRQHSPARVSWVWIVQGKKSVEAAKQLLKYSRMKKDQLENYIALQALQNRAGQKVTAQDWKQREELVNVIRLSEYRRKAS
jgi:hypothetical protein